MRNQDYLEKYLPYYRGGYFRFNPHARMTSYEYDVTAYALASRLTCPRLPRPGDVVWVRPIEQALWPWHRSTWRRYDVEGVGMMNGVEVESRLTNGQVVTRAHYHQTWRFDENHSPKEVSS